MATSDEEPSRPGAVAPAPARFLLARTYERESVEFTRMVNLTDGVVAIALTLLVLQLSVPSPVGNDATADIGAVLRDLQAPGIAFFLSFVIIGFSWFGHQRFVERLLGFDNAMILWNFTYLLVLVLVPFASDLVGNYGDSPSALAIYAVVMAALFGLDFPGRVLASRRGLLADRYTRRQWWVHGTLAMTSSVVFLLSIPVLLYGGEHVGPWIWVLIWPISAGVGRIVQRIDGEDAKDATALG